MVFVGLVFPSKFLVEKPAVETALSDVKWRDAVGSEEKIDVIPALRYSARRSQQDCLLLSLRGSYAAATAAGLDLGVTLP